MTLFNLGEVRNASIWSMYRMRDRIDMNPVYQRESDIWTAEKRRLLIDTIINGFDIPKIYMHKLPERVTSGSGLFDYAAIDGKQRLKTIADFIEGRFSLSDEFSYVKDPSINLVQFTYADIAREYPDIKADFDSYSLDVVTIETSDTELIEDMFSRLNEAMPLNAAEKRNARTGPLPAAVRKLVQSKPLFTEKIPFSNRRYRHHDLAAKMLLIASRDNVSDTKKAYIDDFFARHAKSGQQDIDAFVGKASDVCEEMAKIFTDRDPLLRSVGMIILYFYMFERAMEKGVLGNINRPTLQSFEDARARNREVAEVDIASADYNILEFDRYTQSPNDGVALRFRLAVVDEKIFNGALGFEIAD